MMKPRFLTIILPMMMPIVPTDAPTVLREKSIAPIIQKKKFDARELAAADFEKMQVGQKALYEGHIVEKTGDDEYRVNDGIGRIITVSSNDPTDLSWEGKFEVEGRTIDSEPPTRWAPVNNFLETLEVKVRVLKTEF